jgi:hypothetical protein
MTNLRIINIQWSVKLFVWQAVSPNKTRSSFLMATALILTWRLPVEGSLSNLVDMFNTFAPSALQLREGHSRDFAYFL